MLWKYNYICVVNIYVYNANITVFLYLYLIAFLYLISYLLYMYNRYGMRYILKDKNSAPSKVKIHINSSSGWILIKFSHKIDLYVYIAFTKFYVHDIEIFVINRHNITHFCIFRFPVLFLY